MENEITNNENLNRRKAKIFLKENLIVHIKKHDGGFYNGRLFEVKENHLIIHDRKIGQLKILLCEIKVLTEYEVAGK